MYLEGRDGPVPVHGGAGLPGSSSSSSSVAPGGQTKRTAAELMTEIGKLHEQQLAGVWDDDEFQRMKKRILQEHGV